jgi:transposase-like protein
MKNRKAIKQWYGYPHCTSKHFQRYSTEEGVYYLCSSCRKEFYQIANWVEDLD